MLRKKVQRLINRCSYNARTTYRILRKIYLREYCGNLYSDIIDNNFFDYLDKEKLENVYIYILSKFKILSAMSRYRNFKHLEDFNKLSFYLVKLNSLRDIEENRNSCNINNLYKEGLFLFEKGKKEDDKTLLRQGLYILEDVCHIDARHPSTEKDNVSYIIRSYYMSVHKYIEGYYYLNKFVNLFNKSPHLYIDFYPVTEKGSEYIDYYRNDAKHLMNYINSHIIVN